MNYSEMTDFEINKAVSKYFKTVVFLNTFGEPVRLEPDPAATYTGKDFDEVPFDPCNSWADAGPIIQQNAISVGVRRPGESDEWIAVAFLDVFPAARYRHKNPLRAAMIVFLMMQEQSNA